MPYTRVASIVLCATLAASTGACYGSYGAFHKLHGWNGTVSSNKWARSAVHLGLWIIPVYELALVGDFIVFNTIEQLTGDPPLK